MIISFKDFYEKNEKKKAIVFNLLVAYYKDLNDTGTVNIPYFVRARDKYNEIIKSNKDLNFYYKKILKWQEGKIL